MKKFAKVTVITVISFAVISTILFSSGVLDRFFMATAGDYVIHRSVCELTNRATDIIRGEVLSERVERRSTLLPPRPESENWYLAYQWYLENRHEHYEIQTIHQLRVIDVFKGDAQVGDIIEVAQLGGRIGLSRLTNDTKLHFAVGDDLILFMTTFYASHGVQRPGTLLTPFQSVYRAAPSDQRVANELSASIVEAFNDNPQLISIVFEPFSPYTDLTLTVGDLIQIRYESGLGPAPEDIISPPVRPPTRE